MVRGEQRWRRIIDAIDDRGRIPRHLHLATLHRLAVDLHQPFSAQPLHVLARPTPALGEELVEPDERVGAIGAHRQRAAASRGRERATVVHEDREERGAGHQRERGLQRPRGWQSRRFASFPRATASAFFLIHHTHSQRWHRLGARGRRVSVGARYLLRYDPRRNGGCPGGPAAAARLHEVGGTDAVRPRSRQCPRDRSTGRSRHRRPRRSLLPPPPHTQTCYCRCPADATTANATASTASGALREGRQDHPPARPQGGQFQRSGNPGNREPVDEPLVRSSPTEAATGTGSGGDAAATALLAARWPAAAAGPDGAFSFPHPSAIPLEAVSQAQRAQPPRDRGGARCRRGRCATHASEEARVLRVRRAASAPPRPPRRLRSRSPPTLQVSSAWAAARAAPARTGSRPRTGF